MDMAMAMGKTLYVSDLDGTLLNGDSRLSGCSAEILNRLEGEGLLFTYATARSVVSAARVTAGWSRRLPAVTYDGALVVDPAGTVLSAQLLDQEAVEWIKGYFSRQRMPALVYALMGGAEKASYLRNNRNSAIDRYLASRPGDPRQRPVDSYEELFQGSVYHVASMGTEGAIRAACPQVEGREGFYATISQENQWDWWLEIHHPLASKAHGIKKLRELLGVDRIVSFGDNWNDIPLFRASDACYAVENAREELKEIATAVIGPNHRDGVTLWLERHWNSNP